MNGELKIEDLVLGSGKAAVKGALITTQYRGWLEDGTEFDSSYSRGKPFQCVIGTRRVIQGWDQGLMGMQVGGYRYPLCEMMPDTYARLRKVMEDYGLCA